MRQEQDGIVGSMTLGAGSLGRDGRTAVGSLGVLVDESLGYAIMGSLPQGTWSISTEIWIDVIAPLPSRGAELIARAAALVSGSFSRGQVHDSSGRLLVECRQRGRLAPTPPELLESTPADRHDRAPGADRLDAALGLRTEGDVHVLETRRDLANPRWMLHGGISLAASEVVAVQSREERGCSLPTSSVHIVHTRGVPLAAQVEFRSQTRHAGRTLWVTDVIGTVDGKVCTVATVTAQE
ncbi:PaaI family thioesterase [Nocardioides sp. Root190]|uniref:PaaI family thioesterase n=1 Tax=Nocardioides sp. Root190 TaxID=1736488 RepID=UPI0009ECAEC2|nr:hypothetical protein [Nocardioides sp. Root190]